MQSSSQPKTETTTSDANTTCWSFLLPKDFARPLCKGFEMGGIKTLPQALRKQNWISENLCLFRRPVNVRYTHSGVYTNENNIKWPASIFIEGKRLAVRDVLPEPLWPNIHLAFTARIRFTWPEDIKRHRIHTMLNWKLHSRAPFHKDLSMEEEAAFGEHLLSQPSNSPRMCLIQNIQSWCDLKNKWRKWYFETKII